MSIFVNHADFEPHLTQAVRSAWSPHADYVEFEDCYQTAMIWWYGAYGQEFVRANLDDPRHVARRAAYSCRHYIRAERLAKSGFTPTDQSRYVPQAVRKLLPIVFGHIEHPAVDPSAPKAGNDDPATGNNLQTMVADIQCSLALLPLVDREFVEAVTQYGEDFAALCGDSEADQRDAKVEYAGLIEQVCSELNWLSDEDGYDCE